MTEQNHEPTFKEDIGLTSVIAGAFILDFGNKCYEVPLFPLNWIGYHTGNFFAGLFFWVGDKLMYSKPSLPQPPILQYLRDSYHFGSDLADSMKRDSQGSFHEMIQRAERESLETSLWRWREYEHKKQLTGGQNE